MTSATRAVRQISSAPLDALVICPDDAELLDMTKLTKTLEREDVGFIHLRHLSSALSGTTPHHIVVRFDVKLTPTQEAALLRHRERLKGHRPLPGVAP